MKEISVVNGLKFPLDAVTQKFAWLGRSGSGKTYGCKRFVEQLVRAGAQVVVVDTVGVWFGLRRGERGLEIPVLGGIYGDIPLEPTSGALVAEVTVSHGASMVLDTSHFRDAERSRFMEAFGRRLFELKKLSPSAMHVVLDEGQDVVPQNPANNENMMLHEWVRIAKQGRAFGIGLSISSQRPQELNKKALNQTECVLAFQLTGPQERKALEYWLADKGVDTKLSTRLISLEVGTPFVWSPQWLKVSDVFGQVLPIDSDDTSQTPIMGEVVVGRQKLKPIDLGKLRESMAAAVEEHDQNDPQKLKETIKKLQQQLSGKAHVPTVPALAPFADQVLGHLQLLKSARTRENARFAMQMDELKKLVASLNNTIESLVEWSVQSQDPIQEAADAVDQAAMIVLKDGGGIEKQSAAVAPTVTKKETNKSTSTAPAKNPLGLPKGELEVLRAVSTRKDGCGKTLITLMTGLASASVDSYLNRLSSKGLVERGGGIARCTQSGLAAAAPVPPALKGEALLKSHMKSLPSGEARVLAEVLARHPDWVSRDDIARATDLSPASVDSYLNRLSTRELVGRARGKAWISEEVFT